VQINTFLFASMGLTFQLFATSRPNVNMATDPAYGLAAYLLIAMPFVGLVTSIITFQAVIAANNAIRALTLYWDKFSSTFDHQAPVLPALSAGGHIRGFAAGRRLGLALPCAMTPVWSFALCYAAGHFLAYGGLANYLLGVVAGALTFASWGLMFVLTKTLDKPNDSPTPDQQP
jgi:hypothetical protein